MRDVSPVSLLRNRLGIWLEDKSASVIRAEPYSLATAQPHRWLLSDECVETLKDIRKVLKDEHLGALASHVEAYRQYYACASIDDIDELEDVLCKPPPLIQSLAVLDPDVIHIESVHQIFCAVEQPVYDQFQEVFETLKKRVGLSANLRNYFETISQLWNVPFLSSKDSWRKIASTISTWRVATSLSSVHVLRHARGWFPWDEVVTSAQQSKTTWTTPQTSLGILSELSHAHSMGRALALSSSHVGLEVEHRFPTHSSVGYTLGSLLVFRYASPKFLQRTFALSRNEVSVALRAVKAVLSALLYALPGLIGDSADLDFFHHRMGLVFGNEEKRLLLKNKTVFRNFARGWALALVAIDLIQEQFDEDWYFNPRFEEWVASAVRSGGMLSAEQWLQDLDEDVVEKKYDAKKGAHILFRCTPGG